MGNTGKCLRAFFQGNKDNAYPKWNKNYMVCIIDFFQILVLSYSENFGPPEIVSEK